MDDDSYDDDNETRKVAMRVFLKMISKLVFEQSLNILQKRKKMKQEINPSFNVEIAY